MSFKIETSEHLEFILELEDATIYSNLGELLLAAMNDWPTQSLIRIDDFVSELKATFGTPLTEDSLNSLKFNGQNAWQLEASSSLIEMFKLASRELPSNDLEQIILAIVNHLEAKFPNPTL